MSPKPDLPTFLKLCRPGRAVPVRVEVDADTETPVSAFLKLSRGRRNAFLLASVEGGERSARFSFLGAGPRSVMSWRHGQADVVRRIRDAGDWLLEVRRHGGRIPPRAQA